MLNSPPPIACWRRRAELAGIGILWLLMVIGTLAFDNPQDFRQYSQGVERYLNGLSPYMDSGSGYLYPPLFLLFLSPLFVVADPETAAFVWLLFNVALLACTIALIGGAISDRRQRLMLWIMTPLFVPTVISLVSGQVTIVMFAFTTAAWSAYRQDKPALAGALLAVPTWIKFYPALLALYFVWRRDWRAVIGAVASGLVLTAIQIAGVGWDVFWGYFTTFLPSLVSTGQSEYAHSNLSILGFFQRAFMDVPDVKPIVVDPVIFRVGHMVTSVLLLIVTLAVIALPARAGALRRRFDLEYALVLLTALLLGSTLWIQGLVSVLLVYGVLLISLSKLLERNFLVLLSIVTLALIESTLVLLPEKPLPLVVLSAGFLAMMLLWAIVARVLVGDRKLGQRRQGKCLAPLS